ncbi:glucose-1-phosphate adenylyltransferase [Thalassoroseus pseudoceratinae]|uniref:glucose-1-phosphate adenylyltransferase n=1 Tax=Thalassoroseus pseudoceratinae TaxID=2713176 RepID=UPI0014216297|nr:glucose-1-phosphate adenylyltransferase [Thalassoroseus pseudoceratinae]
MHNVLALVLAGGKGSRLEPLTRDRAKPAVPFGCGYRIIDFTLSNCINSGLRRMLVLTQYKAASLDRHINLGWRFLCRELNEFIDVLPPQQRLDENWYQGTADAVYQNIYTIEKIGAEYTLILSGDHIYKMDYSELVRDHIEAGADATVACIPVPLHEGSDFGIMHIDPDHNVLSFDEKPAEPECIPGDPENCLASMGVYVFKTDFLFEQLCQDATVADSRHDFGHNIIPSMIGTRKVRAYPFRDKNTGERCYWRDVGTLDAYYEANMDLVHVDPQLNLYDRTWEVRTYHPPLPPPKFVFNDADEAEPRVGTALDSIVGLGSIVSGGHVERSVISPDVRINSWAHVEDSILFEGVDIGRHAKVRKAIIDKNVHIPAGMEIGYDPELDKSRGFTISEGGVTVIPLGTQLD